MRSRETVKIQHLDIPEALLIRPAVHHDERGFFSEVFRGDWLADHGAPVFVQDNHAFTLRRGVLRGLHFQRPPHAQGKLVRCTRGSILDVAVDIRRGSPTYARHVSTVLSAENGSQMWIPVGFAHGYVALEPSCEVIYKVTDYYDRASEGGIAWNDPALAIEWGLPASEIKVIEKDGLYPSLAEAPEAFAYPSPSG
jgi:dTDP-4-dehydrorhamnose 3,5-epimerase